MYDTYFVEERSGVIGIGPLANQSPELYHRRTKTNWRSLSAWLHLLICLLACPLIIWNLYLLLDLIDQYATVPVDPNTGKILHDKTYHPFGFLVVLSAVLMNLFAGVFALITEAACFSEKLAKFLYIIVYLNIAIAVFTIVISTKSFGIIWLILLFLFMIFFGFGFWRFIIISSIYLNEEGPVWFKPLLYGCLAAIPILTTSSQCRELTNTYGCLPNELFGGHDMFMDLYSFTIMTIITIISALPFLLGKSHQPES